MLIVLLHVNRTPGAILKYAGYVYRPNDKDYIKVDAQGRWHARILDPANKVVDIHYDLTIEGRHVVFRLPIKAMNEKRRILGIARHFERYRISESEISRIIRLQAR